MSMCWVIIISCQLSARHKVVNEGDTHESCVQWICIMATLFLGFWKTISLKWEASCTMQFEPIYIQNCGTWFCQWSDSRQDWITWLSHHRRVDYCILQLLASGGMHAYYYTAPIIIVVVECLWTNHSTNEYRYSEVRLDSFAHHNYSKVTAVCKTRRRKWVLYRDDKKVEAVWRWEESECGIEMRRKWRWYNVCEPCKPVLYVGWSLCVVCSECWMVRIKQRVSGSNTQWWLVV